MQQHEPTQALLRPDRRELIADGIVHAVGLSLALIGFGMLLRSAPVWSRPETAAAAIVYGLVLVLVLAVSMTYNLWPEGERKSFLRRCDHSAIFLLIAATYTPFLERASARYEAQVMLVVIWALALTGVAIKVRRSLDRHWLSLALYLAMGWSGVLVLGPLYETLPGRALTLIILGGALYSLGVVFHVWEKLRFQSAIWHSFVVVAAAVHYSAVLACLDAG